MDRLDELFAEIQQLPTLEQTGWAEDEIAQAQARHPDHADRLHHAFILLRPSADRMNTGLVHRSHCRELLERVAAGADTRPATAAEIASACSHITALVPPGPAVMTVYMRAWARAFPDIPAFQVLDLASYEHVAGTRADDLEAEIHRKLRQPTRTLAAIDCPGRHHGQARPDCPYATDNLTTAPSGKD